MKALIVGAGAVGQVYGLHLQRGGASVGVFVKDKYGDAARAGFTLHPVRRPQARLAPLFVPFPLEIYLKEHFTKVGDQTRSHLQSYLSLAADRELPCAALTELRDGLRTLDG